LLEAQWYCNIEDFVPKMEKVKDSGAPSQPTERCNNPICTNLGCQKLIAPAFAPTNEVGIIDCPLNALY